MTHTTGRWHVALAGTVLQLCLGTVYAWSFFQKPLVKAHGWSNMQAVWALSLAICFLGLSAAWGGMRLPRSGPRALAVPGGLLYGAGYLLAGLALGLGSKALFYLGFGVLGGMGLGLGYVTPVATAAKWFPERKGLVTGMVVMGFGLGAMLMSTVIAPLLMRAFDGNLERVFLSIGAVMLVLTLPAALMLRNPPAAGDPAGPAAADTLAIAGAAACLRTGQFAKMWALFFFNITAGIIFIGFQSPMLQDLLKRARPETAEAALAYAGAMLIAASSLFNGLGRFLWGAVSDRIGRALTFRIILGSQIGVFAALWFVRDPLIFAALVCYILLCYGGGFGSMPSFVLDVFGPRRMPVIYGAILTAWSAAGIVGPQIAAFIKDHWAADAAPYTFAAGAASLSIGFAIALCTSDGKALFLDATEGL